MTSSAFAIPVRIKFDNFKGRSGKIYFLVFNDGRYFPDLPEKAIEKGVLNVSGTNVETTLELPEGDYAITAFLDENRNSRLDLNFLGIPKEMFGFSNNPKILTGAPGYQECDFSVKKPHFVLIHLLKLF